MADEGRQRYVAPEPNAMYTLGHEKWKRAGPTPLSSTAGAVEVRDDKGNVAIPFKINGLKIPAIFSKFQFSGHELDRFLENSSIFWKSSG